ncbi:MAG: peptide chain release factor N(5)-glutamine methyltransferase [Bacillota bacterium]
MITWRDAWKWGCCQMHLAGVSHPSREAHSLLASGPGASPALLRPSETVGRDQWPAYVQRIRRRACGEPLQYIRGEVEFYSRPFRVNRAVLIPRPETEILIDEFLRRAERLPGGRILDLGTGSGVLAVSMACELPGRSFVASDISDGALQVAGENAERHGVADRVAPVPGGLYEPLGGERFAAIVSNPPYVTSAEMLELAPGIRDWEPARALDGGEDGLVHLRAIIAGAPDHLVPGGLLALEVGAGQAGEVAALCRRHLDGPAEIVADLAGIERVVLCHRYER